MNATALWQLGFRGQGVVIASMDTGVDVSHPDLAAQWRGGSNSWFDPYGQNPVTPVDHNGHGTWTMGLMVGRDLGGSSIGVAPDATWIAAKIFDDNGTATVSGIHLGFQWLLDPDGNALTDDAPDVVNNSWSFNYQGCDLEFEPDLQALLAAGIAPVFAAGNYGPGSATSISPANNPGAIAVGAVDNTGAIYNQSSRGPSACGSGSATYPALAAPGVNVRTSDLFGLYINVSGTSFAAPHVSGGLALLLSAFPALSVPDQQNALIFSAVDLGSPGADNLFGAGRIDLLAAYNLIAVGKVPTSTPTPLPSFTPTPTKTATPTPSPAPTQPTPTDQIFKDGFESGNLNDWSFYIADQGQLIVNGAAALTGKFGLGAVLGSGASGIYTSDTRPNAEKTYRAAFSYSPDGISLPGSSAHPL